MLTQQYKIVTEDFGKEVFPSGALLLAFGPFVNLSEEEALYKIKNIRLMLEKSTDYNNSQIWGNNRFVTHKSDTKWRTYSTAPMGGK